ncbi:protein GRAVITROPIC IN THE LIGHT 1 [Nicotiana tomentosiformis]|uniref:protein GRAVITROPIC IN THE LIGHT 1 n=1 Tax=Nicotiana tomentosiformis TaxID=4098 RepID=UPI00051AD175|nr:protein GRAVITROPIC IN THE LIGHT 1 [Nicotiana tomentosiformis]XP_018631075.1 protein GRAVITROPIC IN THE LIGHT 1 [Nicotiana tomentosiformis]
MANKVSNFSDLIQRVTASCLLHPLSSGRIDGNISDDRYSDESEDDKYSTEDEEEKEDPPYVETREKFQNVEVTKEEIRTEKVTEMEMLLGEVFDAVSAVKTAYVSLQEAHCPWDQDKMRVADVAVISELRRLGVLRERFRRNVGGGIRKGDWRVGAATLREVVAPYEATVEELRQEVKAKEIEIDNLREKLKTATSLSSSGGKKSKSKRKVSGSSQAPVTMSPAPDVFETTVSLVKEASKSFTSLLLSLMRSAHWDIAAAVRSIEAASSNTNTPTADSIVGANHAKYALESYVNRKMFQGFDHETFYMDGSLSSLIHPDQHRRDCFTQYRDMKAMDPMELLGILPTCSFGNFCFKKYLAIVHPKMEESLFGDLEQRRQVLAGNHPRSQFYGEFLGLAKAVWLLHLLTFSLDPPPSHFEASKGSEFHPQYMESVVKYSISMGIGGRMGMGLVVGFPVSPGFKLGNGSVVKARVYLVPKNGF